MKKSECTAFSLRKVCDFLSQNDNYCILCHSSPDGDTLGAAFALAMGLVSAGKHCFVRCPDPIPAKYSYFADPRLTVPFTPDCVIAVDVADLQLLGGLAEEYQNKVDLCIDHHISNTRFARALLLDADASATCECVFELLDKMDIPLNEKIASALFTGIATDTGSFKYSNVTAKTHRIAAQLYRYDIHADKISKIMFDTKSKNRLMLERMVLDGAEFHFDERCIVLTVTSEMLEKTGCSDEDLEGIAVISCSVEGVLAGVSIKQKNPDTFRVSLRTYAPLNASEICKKLGGGGHAAAAGCTLTGTAESVKKQLLAVIGSALEESNAGTAAHQ